MNTKGLFFFVPVLLLAAFLSHAQQMGLYPLNQYSVGTKNNVQLRTTTVVQQDTLKIPYIEDFTGYCLPIDSISVDTLLIPPYDSVYRITNLKMHALKSGASIRVLNATRGTYVPPDIDGYRYAKVIDKYSFQLFDDAALSTPSKVVDSIIMHYCNWIRVGTEGYSSIPDTLGFMNNNGGVFINNDMALNPINIGVATFDGVDYRGIPYSTTSSKGYSDNLTSLPFNLSSYSASSNIYISFYWQSKSLGDSPLSAEFLALEFKDISGTWVEVWRQSGDTETEDTFKIAIVPITNISYLHTGFQYRFRSYGVQNGRFAVWNLDYIYIDSNRNANKPYLRDVSIITTNRSALKNYTSVPYKHISDLPIATITTETAQAFITIRDISDSLYYKATIERRRLVRDNLGHNRIKFDSLTEFNQQAYIFTQLFEDTIPGGYMTAPYALKEEFYMQPLDTLGPIDLSFNNFTAIETYFTDYYSYDDGTPEVAFLSINPGGTKVANSYKILKTDTLTHIDYCFVRSNGPDMTNTSIYLSVWKENSKITAATTKATQLISIRYSSEINGFVRYALTVPIVLSSDTTYYIGYTQNAVDALFLGYDKNNDHLNKIFFCNDGTTWQPFSDNSSVPGSLMIRPVFSKNQTITSITDSRISQNQFTLYPNPAKDELHFTGEPEYISIYDLSGLLLLEKKIEDEGVLSTESLSNGLYIIILSKDNYTEAKRLIIQK